MENQKNKTSAHPTWMLSVALRHAKQNMKMEGNNAVWSFARNFKLVQK
jgi:hypothetical protein